MFLRRLLLRGQPEDSEPQHWTLTCPTSPVSKAPLNGHTVRCFPGARGHTCPFCTYARDLPVS